MDQKESNRLEAFRQLNKEIRGSERHLIVPHQESTVDSPTGSVAGLTRFRNSSLVTRNSIKILSQG